MPQHDRFLPPPPGAVLLFCPGQPDLLFVQMSDPGRLVRTALLGLNDPPKMVYRSTLLKQYARDVQTGWISPLSGFENYERLHGRIQNEIVGRTTANGVLITGQRDHFMQRVIGTMVDPKKLKEDLQVVRRSGVSVDDIKDALFAPESVDSPAVRENGKRSVRYIGKNCVVTVNPDTGELIQTNLRKRGKKNA